MVGWKRFQQAASFVLACEAVGAVAGLATSADSAWYRALAKPAWTPPGWVFAPVWIALYALMGVAAYLVWRAGWERPAVRAALGLFLLQLVLNGAWTPLFFGARLVGVGAVVIVALFAVLAWTAVRFFRIRRLAGWLLVPYLLWVAYAASLNVAIWALN